MPDRDPVLVALGDALRQRREQCQLSQEGVSLATGVHRNYVGGIERGERQPTVLTIAKLADALKIPMSELFAAAERLRDSQAGHARGNEPSQLRLDEPEVGR